MRHVDIRIPIMLSLCFSHISFADTPTLADANKLFDFAETAEPSLFYPPAQTQQVNEAGSDWFYRYFSGSDSYAAINVNGNGPYFSGNVYVLGQQFGEGLLFVDTLENLLSAIDAINPVLAGGENAITNQGNGNCVARKLAPENDTAGYRTTTYSGDTPTVTERTEFYEEVTSTKTITIIEQTATDGGSQSVTSNRQISYFESLNGMFYRTENDSVITTSSPGMTNSIENVSETYAPSLFIGPSDYFCEGQEWYAAPVTRTVVISPDLSGDGPIASQTPPTVGTINSVGEIITVRGGTYNTLRMTLSYPDSKTIIWTDLDFGVRVLSEFYLGDSESPSIVDELVQLDLPF